MINSNSSINGKSMMTGKNVVTALRRDAAFIWNAVIVVVFVGFAGLAVASALLDLISIRH
ncbi:MAG: hypothetical protein JSR61_08690 [Proteobacteria bacterium]|nr:hypothetical protein [Pseudomonadota bacterium]